MASSYDIVVDQGSDYSLPFAFKDAEGTAKDLTGCTAPGGDVTRVLEGAVIIRQEVTR